MSSSEKTPLDDGELETAAGKIIGKIVLAFSRFELNLGLCIRNAVGGVDVAALNPLIERLSFKSKLDAMLDIVEHKFSSNAVCIAEFQKWHRRMNTLRARRNSFIHGRWGVHTHAQKVINVAPGLPSSVPQRETRFTIIELEKEFSDVTDVVNEFHVLRERWGI